jgi:hypothetical protein
MVEDQRGDPGKKTDAAKDEDQDEIDVPNREKII